MISKKRKLLIICEGYEEKPYIDKILSFPCFRKEYYSFDESINAKSNTKLFARYQDKLQSTSYDAIFVFCDYDKGSQEILDIKRKFADEIFGGNKEIVDKIFILVNPVTLQVVLSHFGEVYLTHVSKKNNADEVERLTGIKGYDAKLDQINEIVSKISWTNYQTMKTNINKISSNLKEIPSTNFLEFINNLESDDDSWLTEIIKELNE